MWETRAPASPITREPPRSYAFVKEGGRASEGTCAPAERGNRQLLAYASSKMLNLLQGLRHTNEATFKYYDFKMLKQEIRDLESECQSLIRELEPSAMVKRNTVVYNPDNKEWSCSYCTFLNHPELSVCEQCERPKCRRIIDVEGK